MDTLTLDQKQSMLESLAARRIATPVDDPEYPEIDRQYRALSDEIEKESI